ncbi:hypothetical protein BAUCODRAFT_430530 [Baudoinia panamericana UAMH 10762]|uniref:Altered inheritance of mitochondria protein 11 n=1 Tax=Baudoinia panamericana (strain UAMH 10762) TaxID=717646 RepID=M2NGX4_BAUPA|nr:uncharacterized protein BAUCODRAFT_430530 [Baudoinia panamericana UAMH 10762]EMC98554.1 hypothetical protein BAUCODRAFT_430530 [Baudoinia panamericana UAMH 10762]
MSFWDRYLAPGDVRHQRQHEAAATTATAQTQAQALAATLPINPRHQREPRIDAAHRQRRQDGLFFGGVAFTCFSALLTRRALIRRRLPHPAAFTPSNAPPTGRAAKVDGSFDAVEALSLATLNVCSIAMVAAGAMAKLFDIADLEDLRDGVRRGVGFDVYGGEAEADKELEEWIAGVLSGKEELGGGGVGNIQRKVAEKLRELEEQEKKGREGKK